jgi:metallo-beta-lactamase family protein
MVSITFLGAAGTVTGSKYLVEGTKYKILVDAGLFQGPREWREKNWENPPCNLKEVNAVLLTHAHIDHVGILPRFCHLGLKCPVYCSRATAALAELLLLDSAHLQEEEAQYRSERGKSRHHPPLPLYTTPDATEAIRLFRPVQSHQRIEILPGVFAEWTRMGHIIGACSIRLELDGKVITFSGDIGRYNVPILKDPEPVAFGDLLLIESTYGDKEHSDQDPRDALARVINESSRRGGITLVPSFAVGRTQLLLYYLRELKESGRIPNLPIVIDSPMATDATSIYSKNPQDYDDEALGIVRAGRLPFSPEKLHFTRDRQESIKLNKIDEPMVLISASGMLTGGRILHHLKNRVSDPRNTVLFVGFQPPGSRGHWLKSGNGTVRLLGSDYPVRANIEELPGLSAHGDRSELLRWYASCSGKPNRVAVVHGEPDTAKAFSATLTQKMGVNAWTPNYLDKVEV